MLRITVIVISMLSSILTARAVVGAETDTIELLDGKILHGSVTSIGEDGVISGDGLEGRIKISDLRVLERSSVVGSATGTISVELSGGGRLRAKEITVSDETSRIAWGLGGTIELPIDSLRTIRFDTDPPIESFQSAADEPVAGFDRVFAKDGERVIQLLGLVDQLTADAVVFIRDDNEIRLPRSRVYGIVLADVGSARIDGARCRVALRDGSIMPGAIRTLADNVLSIQLSRSVDLPLPWDQVTRIEVQSPRLIYLSDMTPAQVTQQSIVSISRPWQRDRSVSGEALQLRVTDGQTVDSIEFKKGIGTHARCRLSYDLDGSYELFLATLGIHAGTEGRGDCVVNVVADGKTVFSQRVTGQDKQLHELRLDISGVRRLTIAVEPGNDLDLADHVDWCDARLIRKST